MESITFNSQIRGGMIKVPEQYRNLETENIEVILILKNQSPHNPENDSKSKKEARGILGKYMNPSLISDEKSAWELTAKEKYD